MPATTNFDPLFADAITGEIDVPVVTDVDGTPNRVLELDENNLVDITWRLTTSDPVLHPVMALTGQWVVRLSFESFGPETEFSLPEITVPFAAATSISTALGEWQQQFTIPANTAEEGIYQMVTLITYRYPNGSRGAMAGHQEGPMLTFYQDV